MSKVSFGHPRLSAWISISLVFFLIPSLAVVAPITARLNLTDLSDSIYRLYGILCHQIPERSFWILGNPVAVCARCLGIYVGLFLGAIGFSLFRKLRYGSPISPLLVIAALMPLGIDWSLTYFGFWENTDLSRFATGSILGISCGLTLTQSVISLASDDKKEELPSGSS